MDPNMPSPIKITLSSMLKLQKRLQNSGWFLGRIFWGAVFPLDKEFLDRVAVQMSFSRVKDLFRLEQY